MKNLFLDSNIWLSLYHFSNSDIDQFEKLYDMIGTSIRLFVPRQVKNEIIRNRENKLKDALASSEFKKISFPAFCKGYAEYDEINREYREWSDKYNAWRKKIEEDIKNKTLPADRVINRLIEKAKVIECDQFINLAFNRYRIGNPPGKDNKYGDAINWECLLQSVPDGEDLYFISDDKDYKSIISVNEFNPFLKEEWSEKKKSNIYFYLDLVSFLKVNIKDIQLQTEKEKKELIDQLSLSPSFWITHQIITKLNSYSGWTENQIEELCTIAEENNQVSWILKDNDVFEFYDSLLANITYRNDIDSATMRIKGEIETVNLDRLMDNMDPIENEST